MRGLGDPGLLRTNRAFRALWSARVISFAGDQLSLVVLTLFVHERHGTGPAVAGLLIAASAPRLLGPVAGAIADRVEQRRLMRACELGRAALIVAVALTLPSLPVLLLLVAGAATLSTLFMPAGRSAVPVLVEDRELQAANALLATGKNLGLAVGPAVGGALVAVIGTSGALLVDAATSLVAVVLLGRLPALHADEAADPADVPGLHLDIVDGLRFVSSHRISRAILVGLTVGVTFAGMTNVVGVFLIRDTLGGGPAAFGLFDSAWGIGMIAGSLLLIRWGRRRDATRLFAAGWLLTGAGVVGAGVAPTVSVAIVVFTVGGFGNGLDNVATDTIIQRAVPRRLLGRAFGAVYTGASLGGLVAFAAAGPLLELTDPRSVFLLAGTATLGIGLWLLATLPRLTESTE